MYFNPFDESAKYKIHGGVLQNGTRVPKPYDCQLYPIALAAADYDNGIRRTGLPRLKSYHEILMTNYWGFCISRLYAGKDSLDTIHQDYNRRFSE